MSSLPKLRKSHLSLVLFLLFAVGLTVSVVYHQQAIRSNAASDNTVHHVLITGQSLSVGYAGWPALTTTQPYINVMLTSNWEPNKSDTTFTLLTAIPFIDQIGQGLPSQPTETIAAGMANGANANIIGNNHQMLMTVNGLSGHPYVDVRKGTPPYQLGLEQVTKTRQLAQIAGKNYRVEGIAVLHGETDGSPGYGNGPNYKGYLNEWIRDYNIDIKPLTGQADDFPMFIDQISTWTYFGTSKPDAPYNVPIAQLAASEENPAKIILVAPNYFLDYADGIHLTNVSYLKLGEYYGKAYAKAVINKQPWIPLSPKQITLGGTKITAKFNVPVPPIQIDTSQVLFRENFGFEFYDDSASPAKITNAAVSAADTVEITLDKIPSGNNKRLRYAYTGSPNSGGGAKVAGSARGNIRDSDTTPSLYGNNLNNWLVHFDKQLIEKPNFDMSKTLAYCNGTVSRVHLEWQSVPGATLYKIYRVPLQGAGVNLANSGGIAYNDESVSPGSTYGYYISAVTNTGDIDGDATSVTAVSCQPTPTLSPSSVPTSSPSPTPSISIPTNSPTPAPKSGDIGGGANEQPDGFVNILDYVLLFESYGKRPGDTAYHARADINKDGSVNILDYVILFENFGH